MHNDIQLNKKSQFLMTYNFKGIIYYLLLPCILTTRLVCDIVMYIYYKVQMRSVEMQ